MRLGYVDTKKYRIMLFFDLFSKVFRGELYKINKIKSSSFIAIGNNVCIHGNKRDFIVGKNVKIESGAYIQTVSTNGIMFSDNVTVCQNAIIRPSGFYGGNLGWGLIVGHHSSIGAASYIGCSGKIIIGNNVMIGPHCTMIAENHNFAKLDIDMNKQGVSNKGIEIKDNVWIGANVTILDGVTVESGCILAAGTVLTKSTEPNGIYAGVPAKRIKDRV
ncbi:MAG: acyltransferase [Spirochaetia bacterium]|nr:acyltransferase [Spirochaetia bacterium]